MKKHTKIYMEALGYGETDFIPSEISTKRANDIHHIIGRGRTDNKKDANRIENIMAVTRLEHMKFGDNKKYMEYLLETHKRFLLRFSVPFDIDYMNELIKRYQ